MREYPLISLIHRALLDPHFITKRWDGKLKQPGTSEKHSYYIFPLMVEKREGQAHRVNDVELSPDLTLLFENENEIESRFGEQSLTIKVKGQVHELLGECVEITGQNRGEEIGTSARLIRTIGREFTIQQRVKVHAANRKEAIVEQLVKAVSESESGILQLSEGPAQDADFSVNQNCEGRRSWIEEVRETINKALSQINCGRRVVEVKTVFTELDYIPKPVTLLTIK